MKNKSESRRSFLTKGFFKRDQLIKDITSMMQEEGEESEKIKMLTPDGKLVEVDKKVLKNNSSAAKASNADILKWMNGE